MRTGKMPSERGPKTKGREEEMKPMKLTNTLLALIFVVLLAHLVIPLLRTGEATAGNSDAVSPSAIANTQGFTALDQAASEIKSGLSMIAQSNQQIAAAIREHAQSSDRIAQSLDRVAIGMARGKSGAARPEASGLPANEEESDPDWWRQYLDE